MQKTGHYVRHIGKHTGKKFSAVLLMLVSCMFISCVSAGIVSAKTDGMSKAEEQLYKDTEITDEMIEQDVSDFTRAYEEAKEKTENTLLKISTAFIEDGKYFDTDLSGMTYKQIKKAADTESDSSVSENYTGKYKTYTVYSAEDGKTVKQKKEEHEIEDDAVYKTDISEDKWKIFYAAYKTYLNTDNDDASFADDEQYTELFEDFLKCLAEGSGFYNLKVKIHMDSYYYNTCQNSRVSDEDFDDYIAQMNQYSYKQNIVNTYLREMDTYKSTYLSQEAYASYLSYANYSFYTYSDYCDDARNGRLAGIPEAPEKPEKYDEYVEDLKIVPEKIERHVQFTYTLTDDSRTDEITSVSLADENKNVIMKPSQNSSDKADKIKTAQKTSIPEWVYSEMNDALEQDKEYDETEEKNFQIVMDTDYEKQFSDERNSIRKKLEAELEEKLNLKKKGEKIISTAKSKLGSRYCWGASGPEMFDCSGFVYWVMKNSGISVKRLTADSYSKTGTKVDSLDDLLPGDIISIGKSSSHYSHIGIYCGEGKVIEAGGGNEKTHGNNPNACVKITSLSKFISGSRRAYAIRRLI